MHPGVFGFWRSHRHGHHHHDGPHHDEHDERGCEGGCGPRGGPFGFHGHGHGPGQGPGHGPEHDHPGPFGGGGGGDDFGGGGFGVRRPLRFLAYRLELEHEQVAELAAILSELKTERAQSSVDLRRTTTAFADAIGGDTFDEAKVKAATDERVKSDERVQSAVARALGRIHALLQPPQRSKLAYLLRTGALSI
jgi:Spy/CpxP family protein refolding chaperone